MWSSSSICTVILVDDGGRLMVVCNREQFVQFNAHRSLLETQIKVFHVDLQEEMLLPIRDLGKRAIFTGPRGVVLLPGTNYHSSVDHGTMYFRFRRYQRHFGAFQVRRRHTGYIALVWGRLAEHVASFVTTLTGIE
jgi:hypothetical protein